MSPKIQMAPVARDGPYDRRRRDDGFIHQNRCLVQLHDVFVLMAEGVEGVCFSATEENHEV